MPGKYISHSSHSYNSLRTGEFDDDNEYSHNGSSIPDRKFHDRIIEQDQSLEHLERSVSRLGELSLTISKEIDTQNRYLSELELDIEKAHDDASSITKKTKEMINKSGGVKLFCLIVILSIVLFILVLMVIYT